MPSTEQPKQSASTVGPAVTPSHGESDPAAPGARRWYARRGFSWARQSWWIEILTIVGGYFVYELIQGAVPSRRDYAFHNGRVLHRVQVFLHIDLDEPVNHLVNRFEPLALGAGYYYDTLHYLITPSVLLLLWWRRPLQYARWRSALVGASIAALVVFYVYPVAPPRFVVPGITDTLVVHHIFGTVAQNGSPPKFVNDTAAMPSLHVGWALWCAATIVGVTAGRWRYLAWLYPVMTTLVVLGTGNHFLLDAVGGATVLGIGLALTATPLSSWRSGAAAPATGSSRRTAGSGRAAGAERTKTFGPAAGADAGAALGSDAVVNEAADTAGGADEASGAGRGRTASA